MRRAHRVLTVAVLLLMLAACGSSARTSSRPTTAAAVTGSITVHAAQSLSGAFAALGHAFEQDHPGTTVRFNFGGSAALVAQIQQGAPADVFASADEANMQKVVSTNEAEGSPSVFAHNALAIVVAPGNPLHIATLGDLARPAVIVSLCAAQVPCGNYARQAASKARVTLTPKSTESSVAGVLGRVQNGEADAGIVYASDVRAARGKVDGVTIPEAQNVVAAYPAVVLKASENRSTARAFVAYLASNAAQGMLASYGFSPA